MEGDLQTDAAGGSKVHSLLIQKHWGREDLILPSLDEDSPPWSKSKQAPRPPAYYKGEAATRIYDIFVSTPLVRAKLTGDYLEMREEHFLNGSDHSSVILHLDIESFIGIGPPRCPPHDNVKIMIHAVTSARIKRELSDTAEAYAKELGAMLGKNPGANTPRNDNTTGKRVKDATSACKEAKESAMDLAAATNTLPSAMDKLLVGATDKVT